MIAVKILSSIRVLLGLLFVVAAIGKGLDLSAFALEIKTLLIPFVAFFTASTADAKLFLIAFEPAIETLALFIPLTEMMLGLFFLFNLYSKPAGFIAAFLLLVFSVALAVNLTAYSAELRHCGCFGILWEEPLNLWSLVRNGFLIALSLLISLQPTLVTRHQILTQPTASGVIFTASVQALSPDAKPDDVDDADHLPTA